MVIKIVGWAVQGLMLGWVFEQVSDHPVATAYEPVHSPNRFDFENRHLV